MKNIISVHGRFHAFELAKGLYKKGLLESLFTTYPAFLVNRITASDLPVISIPYLEIYRRAAQKIFKRRQFDLFLCKSFGEFVKNKVKMSHGSGMLLGWSSATLEAIRPAQDLGRSVTIERGSTHIVEQMDVLKMAYSECGLTFDGLVPEIVAREEEEYDLADRISVPSKNAAVSFLKRGFPSEKILVNSLGVDLSLFKPSKRPPNNSKPKIIFAGEIGIRKGIPWLLKAFKKVSKKSELYLFGEIERGFEKKLKQFICPGVKICGPVSMLKLAMEYRKADIFCLPSIEEGFGLVVLQAMASGLPVVVSDAVGASDVLRDGKEGIIVPAFNEQSLSEALELLIDDVGVREKIGCASHKRISSQYSWQHYLERAVKIYDLE